MLYVLILMSVLLVRGLLSMFILMHPLSNWAPHYINDWAPHYVSYIQSFRGYPLVCPCLDLVRICIPLLEIYLNLQISNIVQSRY